MYKIKKETAYKAEGKIALHKAGLYCLFSYIRQ